MRVFDAHYRRLNAAARWVTSAFNFQAEIAQITNQARYVGCFAFHLASNRTRRNSFPGKPAARVLLVASGTRYLLQGYKKTLAVARACSLTRELIAGLPALQ